MITRCKSRKNPLNTCYLYVSITLFFVSIPQFLRHLYTLRVKIGTIGWTVPIEVVLCFLCVIFFIIHRGVL